MPDYRRAFLCLRSVRSVLDKSEIVKNLEDRISLSSRSLCPPWIFVKNNFTIYTGGLLNLDNCV